MAAMRDLGRRAPPQGVAARHPSGGGDESPSTPICRCRVLYLGSAVPHITKDGLQGIQEPLRELYPEQGAMGAKGIDSWLSVWSNGLLLENVDENHKKVTRFFPIESLHYCAAVRYVLVPASSGEKIARFLPLDSPFARHPNINHPPLFACIMRRTTGIKVLECHVFICKRETAANALVRCCFHAYADSMYAQHLEKGTLPPGAQKNGAALPRTPNPVDEDSTLTSIEKVEGWRLQQQQQQQGDAGSLQPNGSSTPLGNNKNGVDAASTSSNGMGSASVSMLILDNGSADEELSILNGDDNYKVWAPASGGREGVYNDYATGTMRSVQSSGSMLRNRRPRQMVVPAAAPPPPPPVLVGPEEGKTRTKKRDKKPKQSVVDEDSISLPARKVSSVFNFPINGNRPPGPGIPYPQPPQPGVVPYPVFAGRPPMNGYGPQPAYLVPVPLPLPAGKSKSKGGFKFGTFSARGKKSKGFIPPPPPPPFMMMGPGGPPVLAAPPPMALGMPVPMPPPPLSMRRAGSHMSLAAEEPIYMPAAARPLSPVASYQPGHFPHEAYMMQQQYTSTLERPVEKEKKKKKGGKNKTDDDAMAMMAAEDASIISASGIYRKGHMNERAFSYSIRQEHRSRSYSSLANYPPGDLREQDKKEREMMQLVHDLDLSGDDLERSEVPVSMYPRHRQPR